MNPKMAKEMPRQVVGDFTAGVLARVRDTLPGYITWLSETKAMVCNNGILVFNNVGSRLYCCYDGGEIKAICIAIVENQLEMEAAIEDFLSR